MGEGDIDPAPDTPSPYAIARPPKREKKKWRTARTVMHAKAGIPLCITTCCKDSWIPACAGMTVYKDVMAER
jgi:hypothetical protein